MRAYYGSRFSPNMTETPEGFLICHNVPIARTGWYEYLGEEIGVEDQTGKIVQVYRSPEEVFSPGAMASFEGKVLTDDHPPEAVTPDNATRYTKGVVQNVRQGSAGDSDLLLADLVVYDQNLINEIQEGKREVSCGYDCLYEPFDSDGPDQLSYRQKQICGNHVAVVKSGRAGDRVAIKDSKTKPKGVLSMPSFKKKNNKPNMTSWLVALGLKKMATDAEPEEIMDAINAMNDEAGSEEEAKDEDPAIQALNAKIDQLAAAFAKFAQGATGQETADPIDAAIAELEQPSADNEEESHTIPAEQMDEEGPVSSPEDRPQSPLTGDNAYKIAALKAMKPILAQIKDPAQRKLAADAAIASIKGKPAKNTYAAIKPQKPANDNKTTSAVDPSQLGKDIRNKHNPHYKDRA